MLFGLTIFLSAFLLFQVQLITAKHLLPWFGGAPAVWTTCEVFFQVVLLGGYAYAHCLNRTCTPRRQFVVHTAVLLASCAALAALAWWGGVPLLAPGALKPSGAEGPVGLLLLTLLATVGLPYFALSATGPLLQGWHSRSSSSLDRTYRLYALSNAGSLLGLLSYPFGVERILDLSQQAWGWSALFLLFAACCALTAWLGRAQAQPPEAAAVLPLEARRSPRPAVWVLLSFTSSALFLATTNQLSQEVTVVPFLWALPLAIYLVSFVICFDKPHWYSRRWFTAGAMVATVGVALRQSSATTPIPAQIAGYGLFLFFLCMVCHGELVALRPEKRGITLYYLLIAVGGAAGGAFVSLAAPLLFSGVWELYITLLVGWMVVGGVWWGEKNSPLWRGDAVLFALAVAIAAPVAVPFVIVATPLRRNSWVIHNPWVAVVAGGALLAVTAFGLTRRSAVATSTFWSRGLLALMVGLTGKALFSRMAEARGDTVFAARNFYGLVRVIAVKDQLSGEVAAYKLIHGVTNHGVEFVDPATRDSPTTYYAPSSGVGLAARIATARTTQPIAIGVLGLGVGTIGAYARPGDSVRFYEIDPVVISLAGADSPFFSFLRDCRGAVKVVAGDARLSLERENGGGSGPRFDLLALDAFSGDGIPLHLLTVEAFALYAARLRGEDSILAVHITNAYLDLEPVIKANARALGFSARRVDTSGSDSLLPEPSTWILLCRNPAVFDPSLYGESMVRPLGPKEILFTDKYSNLFRVLR